MCYNERTINCKFTRRELCELLLALLTAHISSNGSLKWLNLHDKIIKILEEYDEKHLTEEA